MTDFEFLALVVAIPLGLALVEIAQGLSTALRRRETIRIGWLTPLLALIILVHIGTAWFSLWKIRESFELSLETLQIGIFLAVLFYLTASFVFPDDPKPGTDLDDWFFRHRVFALGGTFALLLAFRFFMGDAFVRFADRVCPGLVLAASLCLAGIVCQAKANRHRGHGDTRSPVRAVGRYLGGQSPARPRRLLPLLQPAAASCVGRSP